MTKLDWSDDHSRSGPGYRAEYRGLVLKAVHDDCPSNPFEDWDGHWPMLVRYDGSFTTYDRTKGTDIGSPLDRFNDALLVHLQHHIAKTFDMSVQTLLETHCDHWDWPEDDDGYHLIPKHCTDVDALREAFACELGDVPNSRRLDVLSALYNVLDIPNLRATSRGHCQGDQADLLIVATPEAQAELRSQPEDMDNETWAKTLAADMQAQVDLYSAWAWGDVYGFVIENEHGEELDSCWGYYGSEFDKSGLEEAAIEAADHIADRARKTRLATLRELVLNRVPLRYRPGLLDLAGEVQHA